jgi:hypothetical protein
VAGTIALLNGERDIAVKQIAGDPVLNAGSQFLVVRLGLLMSDGVHTSTFRGFHFWNIIIHRLP